jgi:hypothetical protein
LGQIADIEIIYYITLPDGRQERVADPFSFG